MAWQFEALFVMTWKITPTPNISMAFMICENMYSTIIGWPTNIDAYITSKNIMPLGDGTRISIIGLFFRLF
jgi:hypothetical protein